MKHLILTAALITSGWAFADTTTPPAPGSNEQKAETMSQQETEKKGAMENKATPKAGKHAKKKQKKKDM